MQFQPFGLEPIDQNWGAMTGPSAPRLCTVLASDTRAYATGDPVWFESAPAGPYPIVTGFFGWAGPRWDIGVVVAVSPGTPQDPSVAGVLPTVSAGVKAGNAQVWVLPACARRFMIAGDAQSPNRNLDTSWGSVTGYAPMPPTADGIEHGDLFAGTAYAAPVGGRSAVALDGTSFTTRGPSWGVLHVEGLAQGMGVAPRSKYIVTFRPR